MKFESTLIGKPIRRVVIELPEDRAKALAFAITDRIVWDETDVEYELRALYDALYGH